MELSVTILGTRGSVPVSGKQYSRYGGATTCVLFQAGDDCIVLDAGTGILSLPPEVLARPSLPLLLTHTHADHLLGLPLCPYAMQPDKRLDVYTEPRAGLNARDQVCRLLSPPLWPVGPDELPAEFRFHDLPETMRLGAVQIDAIPGNHPGGVSLLRLCAGGRRVVFATDCTLDDRTVARLADFARDCDLLLCDGQFSDEEAARCVGFGHASWSEAGALARACGAKRLLVIHHAPFRSDAALDAAAAELRTLCAEYDFAKEGERICL